MYLTGFLKITSGRKLKISNAQFGIASVDLEVQEMKTIILAILCISVQASKITQEPILELSNPQLNSIAQIMRFSKELSKDLEVQEMRKMIFAILSSFLQTLEIVKEPQEQDNSQFQKISSVMSLSKELLNKLEEQELKSTISVLLGTSVQALEIAKYFSANSKKAHDRADKKLSQRWFIGPVKAETCSCLQPEELIKQTGLIVTDHTPCSQTPISWCFVKEDSGCEDQIALKGYNMRLYWSQKACLNFNQSMG